MNEEEDYDDDYLALEPNESTSAGDTGEHMQPSTSRLEPKHDVSKKLVKYLAQFRK